MPPRLSIPAQVSLGFYAAIGAILLIGGASLLSLQEVREAAIEVERNRRIMADTEALVSELMDAETEGRGFVITGTQRPGPPHLDAVVRVSAILPRLHGLVRDPRARASLMAIERLAWERLEMVGRLVATRRRAGFEAARRLVLADRGRELMAHLRREVSALRVRQKALLDLSTARAEISTRNSMSVVAFGGFLSALFLAIAAYVIRRNYGTVEALRTETLQVKTDFINMASHELRTPLTAIKLSVDVVRDGIVGATNAEQRQFLDSVKRNVDRLVRLINDVLDFQKMDVGRFEFRLRTEDLSALVREAAESFRPLARSKGLELDAELPPEPLLVDCDKDRIAQVLANFVSNALKFTPRGRIRLAAARVPAGTKVLVADEGIGISKEGRGRLFRTFAQLEAGREAGGTGLGLALAKKIVESHGGSIGVDSEVGRGSTFFFVLPAARGGYDGQKDPGRGRRSRHPAADGDPAPEGRL